MGMYATGRRALDNPLRSKSREQRRQNYNLHHSQPLVCNQGGFASIIVLILLVSFAVFGMEIFIKSQSQYRVSKREAERIQAVAIADGGVEWAKSELTVNPDWPGGHRTIGEGELTVSINLTADLQGYWVTSRAQIGLARRNLQVLLVNDNGDWIINDYEVLYH